MNTTIQPIPELDNRSESQTEQIHDWLAELGIRGTIEKLRDEWGLRVTYNKLQRYRKRMFEKQQLAEHLEHEIAMPEYLALLNARPLPYDEAGLALIQKRAYELAHETNISAAKLATLQRIFNYKTVRADIAHRKQIDQRNTVVREKTLALREQESARRAANSKLKTENSKLSPQSDELGPYATNWDEVGDRACKHFGITREELIRRAQLRRTWKNPNIYPSAPAPAPNPEPDADHVASCAAQAHEDSSVSSSVGLTVSVSPVVSPCADSSFDSNHECTSKQEPAPVPDIPVETNTPTAPSGNPPSPLEALAAHNAQFFKAIGAQAATALNALNARTHS